MIKPNQIKQIKISNRIKKTAEASTCPFASPLPPCKKVKLSQNNKAKQAQSRNFTSIPIEAWASVPLSQTARIDKIRKADTHLKNQQKAVMSRLSISPGPCDVHESPVMQARHKRVPQRPIGLKFHMSQQQHQVVSS